MTVLVIETTSATKVCGDCKRALPLDRFHKDVHRSQGVARWCKECACARSQARYAKNRESVRQQQATYYAENREQVGQRQAAYYREGGKALRLEGNRRRRARLRAADVRVVTERDIQRLVARYAGLCAYCKAAAYEDLDHIIPIHRGGRHAIGNLIPSCGPCNNSKFTSLIVEWKSR